MKVLSKVAAALALTALALVAKPQPSSATPCNVAYVFVNGVIPTAAQFNANPNQWAACFTTIDNSNVGPLGFYASQIVPTSTATATFGGALAYTFPAGVVVGGPLTSATTGGFSGRVTAAGVTSTLSVAINGTSLPSTSGTQMVVGADLSGFGNFLASGNRFLFRTGAGTTFATFDSAAGFTSSLPISGSTGAFSSTVSATQFHAGTPGVAASTGAFFMGTANGAGQETLLKTDTANVSGVAQTVFGIAIAGVNNYLAVDGTGKLGVLGGVTAGGLGTFVGLTAGTGTSQGSSNGATVAWHPPTYTAAGAATAGTEHIVRGTVDVTLTAAATGSASVTLAGAAIFASATSYIVAVGGFDLVSGTGPNSQATITASRISASSISVNFTNAGVAITAVVRCHYIAIGS
ncbi:MAG: hypothetical protein JWO85_2242 [Candidatus Eremiobacteraeota bacterium]|nr:hypothetical protein [Candidatus Eremiobacteraeota bacterium]